MKKKLIPILIGLIIFAIIIILPSAVFVVHQKEAVALKEFNKIVSVAKEPGLYFKTPFIQSVQSVSLAEKIYDIPASDVITKDKKSMIADTYVLWRVTDPVKYIQTLSASDMRAEERIEAAVYNATKIVISSMSQDELIEARGEKLTKLITDDAGDEITGYGIEIVKAEIKALDLPDDNKAAVYDRMISERQNIAASYTAEGKAEAQKIRNETDKQVTVMRADAEKQAQVLEAQGEAEYMKILQKAYNTEEKAEFYNYIRSLDAMRDSLQGDKTLILDKDSELVKILYGAQ